MTASNKRSTLLGFPKAEAKLTRLIGLFVLCASGSAGETAYCAYEVRVSKPSGGTFANVPVGMVERGIQIATAWTTANGTAKFCDAPFHVVDIVVGMSACGYGLVLVKNVKPTWPTTRRVLVTYAQT